MSKTYKTALRKVLEFLMPFPFMYTYKPPNQKGVRHQQFCLHDEPGVTLCTCNPKKENEMYGNYVVINQWDNGRLLAQIVSASGPEAAAKAKQEHLDRTSKQRNNRVVAVSERPVGKTHESEHRGSPMWVSVPLVQVVQEEVPPPPPPKVTKVKSTYATAFSLGGAGARLMYEAGSGRRPGDPYQPRSSYDPDESY